MAKESMKAREVKREKLAKRYAHKREEIAAKVKSGEMDHEEALGSHCRNCRATRIHSASTNRCQADRPSEGIYPSVRYQPYPVPRDGFGGSDPRREEGELVVYSSDPAQNICAGSDVPDKRGSSTEGAVACETGCGAAREEGAERRPPHRSAAARAGPKGRAAATIRRE